MKMRDKSNLLSYPYYPWSKAEKYVSELYNSEYSTPWEMFNGVPKKSPFSSLVSK